jgi:CBS domain-containing protein
LSKQVTFTETFVDEIMSTDVHVVDCHETVRTTASIMAKEGHGCVVVLRDDLAVGIVTEQDIVQKVTADGIDPSKILVEDIMSSPLVTISPKATVQQAAEKMSAYEIRKVVVVNDFGSMVGLLTAGDLAKWLAKKRNYSDPTLNAIARLKSSDVSSPYA